MSEFAWEPNVVEALDQMRMNGMSASEIAEKLSTDFAPITRSAVLGKVNRLRIQRGEAATGKPRERHRTPRPAIHKALDAAPVKAPAKPASEATPAAPSLRDKMVSIGFRCDATIFTRTSDQCCYPHPDDLPSATMRVCGNHIDKKGLTYCTAHLKQLSLASAAESITMHAALGTKRKPSATLHRAGGKL